MKRKKKKRNKSKKKKRKKKSRNCPNLTLETETAFPGAYKFEDFILPCN